MALSPSEKQAAYRARQKAAEQNRLDVIEAALCEDLSSEDRAALADQLDDLAMRYLWRSKELAQLAQKVRPPGWTPPGLPP